MSSHPSDGIAAHHQRGTGAKIGKKDESSKKKGQEFLTGCMK